jgi:hypothetical protein
MNTYLEPDDVPLAPALEARGRARLFFNFLLSLPSSSATAAAAADTSEQLSRATPAEQLRG